MGQDSEGEKIKDSMRLLTPLLIDSKVDNNDKLRAVILYIISKGGESDFEFFCANIFKLSNSEPICRHP